MAVIKRPKQVLKRIKQNRERNSLLSSQRSAMRTSIKKVLAAVLDKNKEQASSLLSKAQSELDKMAKKGVIKPNKAARHKSRLNLKVKSL